MQSVLLVPELSIYCPSFHFLYGEKLGSVYSEVYILSALYHTFRALLSIFIPFKCLLPSTFSDSPARVFITVIKVTVDQLGVYI